MGISPSRRSPWEHSHTRIKSEENGIDPDDGNSRKCSACTLPIFSTPFKMKHGRFLHDRCANLPTRLNNHVFHLKPLQLKENWEDSTMQEYSCDKCSSKCGSFYYECTYDSSCNLRLDLLCSKQVDILHRSHDHRLMVVRASAAFICGVCGTRHQRLSAPSFYCTACAFWIHTDCASSPNAVRLLGPKKHHHSLFLAYNVAASTRGCECQVCGKRLLSLGVYVCWTCRYFVHVRCDTSDPRSFEPVLIRDAKLVDLLHLPMADERLSVVGYMLENTSARDDDDETEKNDDNNDGKEKEKDNDDKGKEKKKGGNDVEDEDEDDEWETSHKHSLIFHEVDDDEDDENDGTEHSSRVCNACVQLISPPFYTCSKCPDFLLHSSCAKLPTKIQHPFHRKHTFFLSTKPPKSSFDIGFNCNGCGLLCNGFAYSCKTCLGFTMDVLCALMPPSITHESHGRTHILYMSSNPGKCSCCNLELERLYYECTNCRHLKLHAHCALLPSTLTHKFDKHPLKLVTSTKVPLITNDEDAAAAADDDDEEEEEEVDDDDDDDDDDDYDRDYDDSKERLELCEVCEKGIKKKRWYYSCNDCEMSLHVNCIPFLDRLSRVKFGIRFDIYCHDCPVTLVTQNSLAGHFCNGCTNKFKYENNPHRVRASYECSKCNHRLHEDCTRYQIKRWNS